LPATRSTSRTLTDADLYLATCRSRTLGSDLPCRCVKLGRQNTRPHMAARCANETTRTPHVALIAHRVPSRPDRVELDGSVAAEPRFHGRTDEPCRLEGGRKRTYLNSVNRYTSPRCNLSLQTQRLEPLSIVAS
jgi:hypothetical protein